jgi:hypothetical protein
MLNTNKEVEEDGRSPASSINGEGSSEASSRLYSISAHVCWPPRAPLTTSCMKSACCSAEAALQRGVSPLLSVQSTSAPAFSSQPICWLACVHACIPCIRGGR